MIQMLFPLYSAVVVVMFQMLYQTTWLSITESPAKKYNRYMSLKGVFFFLLEGNWHKFKKRGTAVGYTGKTLYWDKLFCSSFLVIWGSYSRERQTDIFSVLTLTSSFRNVCTPPKYRRRVQWVIHLRQSTQWMLNLSVFHYSSSTLCREWCTFVANSRPESRDLRGI
jgi:hypothetical protein